MEINSILPEWLIARGITKLLAFDFETFYSKDFTLKKMSTTMYIMDTQFKVHGVGVSYDNQPTKYLYDPIDIQEFFEDVDWKRTAILAHHTNFDGLILARCYGHTPAYYLDTLSMARPILMHVLSNLSIDSIAQHYNVGGKTEGLDDTKGKHELTFTEQTNLGNYCSNDVLIMVKVFVILAKLIPEFEFDIIDWHIRMYVEGEFIIDRDLAKQEIKDIHERKQRMFELVRNSFPVEFKDSKLDTITILRSGQKFADILTYNKIKPPTKISKTTGKIAYAFAKTDVDFMALAGQGDIPKLLYEARVESKSDTALNKAKLLLAFSNFPPMPLYVNYWKAATGRTTGGDKLQAQNMTRGGNARKCLTAKKKYIVLSVDSSGIELRVSLWFSGQQNKIDLVNAGGDLYKDMATSIYNKPLEEINKFERGIGKVTILSCLGAYTKVLCDTGIKNIVDVTTKDKVWNGRKFVWHKGLVNRGMKRTLNISGISITSNHRVLLETYWMEAKQIRTQENTLYQMLTTAAANLLSQDTYSLQVDLDMKPCLSNVRAMKKSILSTCTTLKTSKLCDVLLVEKRAQESALNYTGDMQILYQMMNTVEDYLIGYQLVYKDAITLKTKTMNAMGNDILLSKKIGDKTKDYSLPILYRYLNEIKKNWNWTELTTTLVTQKEIYDLLQSILTYITDAVCIKFSLSPQESNNKTSLYEKLLNSSDNNYESAPKPVYDLLDCEDGNRFTIITNDGPMILHNCQYGTGIATFDNMLKSGSMAPPIHLALENVQRIHHTFRTEYQNVVYSWTRCKNFLYAMTASNAHSEPEYKGLTFTENRVNTHHGMYLNYNDLQVDKQGTFTYQGAYGVRKKIYGALAYNNIIQHIARNIVYFQINLVNQRYKPIHVVHDETSIIIPEEEFDEANAYLLKCFRTAPPYFTGIKLDAEVEWGKNAEGISYYAK